MCNSSFFSLLLKVETFLSCRLVKQLFLPQVMNNITGNVGELNRLKDSLKECIRRFPVILFIT